MILFLLFLSLLVNHPELLMYTLRLIGSTVQSIRTEIVNSQQAGVNIRLLGKTQVLPRCYFSAVLALKIIS